VEGESLLPQYKVNGRTRLAFRSTKKVKPMRRDSSKACPSLTSADQSIDARSSKNQISIASKWRPKVTLPSPTLTTPLTPYTALEYERAHNPAGTLQPFFDSSIPNIRHPEVRAWAGDLMVERERLRLEGGTGGQMDGREIP
jgi:hypothetical protein